MPVLTSVVPPPCDSPPQATAIPHDSGPTGGMPDGDVSNSSTVSGVELAPNAGHASSSSGDASIFAMDVTPIDVDFPPRNLDVPYKALDVPSSTVDVPSSAVDVHSSSVEVPYSVGNAPSSAVDVPSRADDLPSSAVDVPYGAVVVPSGTVDGVPAIAGRSVCIPHPFSTLEVTQAVVQDGINSPKSFDIVIDMICNGDIQYILSGPFVVENELRFRVRSETDENASYIVKIVKKGILSKKYKNDVCKNFLYKCECPVKKVCFNLDYNVHSLSPTPFPPHSLIFFTQISNFS